MQLNKWVTSVKIWCGRTLHNRSKDTDNDAYTGPIFRLYTCRQVLLSIIRLDGSYGGTTTEDPAYIEKYGSNFC